LKQLRKIIKRGTALIPVDSKSLDKHRDFLQFNYQFYRKHIFQFLKTKKLFSWLVVYPWLLVAFYVVFLQTSVYQSSARILIEKDEQIDSRPMPMGFMGNNSVTSSENYLTSKHIQSRELLNKLEKKIAIKSHFQSKKVDFLSRLSLNTSYYGFLKYYRKKVFAVVDPETNEIVITASAFSPEKSKEILAEIIKQTKTFVNHVSNTLANKQYQFAKMKLHFAKEKLFEARKSLIEWQNQNGMFDPQEAAKVVSSVMAELKGKLVQKQTEFITYSSFMQPNSNKIVTLKEEIHALKEQIERQTRILLGKKEKDGKLNQVMFDFEWVHLQLRFAQAEYQAAQQAYDAAAINLAKNQNIVIEIEKPNIPDEASSPHRFVDLTNVLVILLILFVLTRMSIILVREHMD